MTQTKVTKLSKALLVLSTLLVIGGIHMHHLGPHHQGHHEGGHHLQGKMPWGNHHHGGMMGHMRRLHKEKEHSHSNSLPSQMTTEEDDVVLVEYSSSSSQSLPVPPKGDVHPRGEGKLHKKPMPEMPEDEDMMKGNRRGHNHHKRDEMRPRPERMDEDDMEMPPRKAHGLEHHDRRRRGPQSDSLPMPEPEMNMKNDHHGPAHVFVVVVRVIGCLMTLTGIVGLVAGARETKCATTAFCVLLVLTIVVALGATAVGRHHAVHHMCSEENHPFFGPDAGKMMPKPDMMPPQQPRPAVGDEKNMMPPQQIEVVEIDVVEVDEVSEQGAPRGAHALSHHGKKDHHGKKEPFPHRPHHEGPHFDHQCAHMVNKHVVGVALHILVTGAILLIVAVKLRKAITMQANPVVTGAVVGYTAVQKEETETVEVCCDAAPVPVKSVE